MATVQQAPSPAVDVEDLRPLLRRAQRTWRRAGVLPADRRRLSDELHGELSAASEAGRPPSSVLGDDAADTLREWARERDVSGQSLRIGTLALLTLVSVLIGSLVLITDEVVETLVPGAPFITHGAIWVAVLVSSVLVSWSLAPLSCWAVLHRGGDPRAGTTARWIFALLPVGAGIALLVDIAIATISGTDGPFIPVMAVATALIFGATPVVGRHLATRYSRHRP